MRISTEEFHVSFTVGSSYPSCVQYGQYRGFRVALGCTKCCLLDGIPCNLGGTPVWLALVRARVSRGKRTNASQAGVPPKLQGIPSNRQIVLFPSCLIDGKMTNGESWPCCTNTGKIYFMLVSDQRHFAISFLLSFTDV